MPTVNEKGFSLEEVIAAQVKNIKSNNWSDIIISIISKYREKCINILLVSLIKNRKLEILLKLKNFTIGIFSDLDTSMDCHEMDYYIFLILVYLIDGIRYKELFYLKTIVNYDEIYEVCSREKSVDYFFILHRKLNSYDNFDFDHVSIFDRRLSNVYDIEQQNASLYIKNGSCALNSMCYILDREFGDQYSPKEVEYTFKLLKRIPDIIKKIYSKI